MNICNADEFMLLMNRITFEHCSQSRLFYWFKKSQRTPLHVL